MAGVSYTSPIPNGTVTSTVGPRNTGIPGASTDHKGTDFAAPIGTPVYSSAPGTVVGVYPNGQLRGYGNSIEVQHADGSSTFYAHLNSTGDTYVGQRVGTDAPIGQVGNTGVGSGPHLHYERYDSKTEELMSPFGDNDSLNSKAATKNSKVSKDGSQKADEKSKKEGDQDGTDENDKKNGELAKKTNPLSPNKHKDIKGTPSNYQQTTTSSAVTVLPTHEPWSGHPVSCKAPRGGTGDNATPGSGSGGGGTGSQAGGTSGSSNGSRTSTPGSGGQALGSGVDSPTNGKTIKGLTEEQTQDYLDRLGQRESGNNYGSINSIGFSGRFQFGTAALISTGYMNRNGGTRNSAQNSSGNWTGKDGVNSLQDWLNSPQAQTNAAISLANQNYDYLSKRGVVGNGDADNTAGYLAAAHLKGAGGAANLARSGNDAPDGYGTRPSSYRAMMKDIGSRPGKKKKKNLERGDPRKEDEQKQDPKSANNKNGVNPATFTNKPSTAGSSSGLGSGTSTSPSGGGASVTTSTPGGGSPTTPGSGT